MCSVLTWWLHFRGSDALLWLRGHLNLCSEPYTHADAHTCTYINSESIVKESTVRVWIKHCCSYLQVRKKKEKKSWGGGSLIGTVSVFQEPAGFLGLCKPLYSCEGRDAPQRHGSSTYLLSVEGRYSWHPWSPFLQVSSLFCFPCTYLKKFVEENLLVKDSWWGSLWILQSIFSTFCFLVGGVLLFCFCTAYVKKTFPYVLFVL